MDDRLAPARCALLVVDVQNDYCHRDGVLGAVGANVGPMADVVPAIQGLIDGARAAAVPVIFTRNCHSPDTDTPAWGRRGERPRQPGSGPARRGTWGAELFALQPAPGEPVIDKPRYDAFLGTSLDMILRSRGVSTVVCAGVSSSVCVDATAKGAVMRDYDVVVVEDASASDSAEEHAAVMAMFRRYYGRVLSVADVLAAWPAASTSAP